MTTPFDASAQSPQSCASPAEGARPHEANPPWTLLDRTAAGAPRASVAFTGFRTLWFNTGTLCNIACASCYIESSPSNERLVYLTPEDVAPHLDALDALGPAGAEIGFTGGEPFLNPHMVALAEMALGRGRPVLILTNAMRPMMRPTVAGPLADLIARHSDALTIRVSLDHHTRARHDAERGAGAFDAALAGLSWLSERGARLAIAGRAGFAETIEAARVGYHQLFAERGLAIDARDPAALVLFPDMDVAANPPEITEACWSLVGADPAAMMCASSRMVVRRAGAEATAIMPCTLIAYDERVERGPELADALGPTVLSHKFCAQFCVLGGASCSA